MFRDEERSDPNNWKFILLQPPPGGKVFFNYFFMYIITILENVKKPEKVSFEFLRDYVVMWNQKTRACFELIRFVNNYIQDFEICYNKD